MANDKVMVEMTTEEAEQLKAFREEKAKRIEASWMPLPMVPERCGMIAFDVLDDRCAVVWQQQKDQAAGKGEEAP